MFSSILNLFKHHHPYIIIDLSDKTFKVGQVSWTLIFPSEAQAAAMAKQFLSLQHSKSICINAVMHGVSIDIVVDYATDIDMNTVYEVISDIIVAEKETREE